MMSPSIVIALAKAGATEVDLFNLFRLDYRAQTGDDGAFAEFSSLYNRFDVEAL